MNLLMAASGGRNILIRPGARPTFYAASSLAPAIVEVYWRYSDEAQQASRLIGRYLPGQQGALAYTPTVDKNIVLSTIGISAGGVRSVRDLRDAAQFEIDYQRETAAPVVHQIGDSTNNQIQLEIDNYSSFAIARRVRTADDSAMTINLAQTIISVNPGEILSRVVYLLRPSPGTSTRDVWARVSHSSIGSAGPWGAESTAQMFTWANSGGSGGTTGTGDPYGGDPVLCFSGNVRIQIEPGEYVSFYELFKRYDERLFEFVNEAGRYVAALIRHPGRPQLMIDMGDGELVTPGHMMKRRDRWAPAGEVFAEADRVEFEGDVFNLHVFTTDPRARHYILENGEIAHNVKIAG